ncbi:MAG TPA: nicotinate phosphoribosyltransferase, partial [Syntrophales bacterium]|nr:nicotinate phosphoribosyltransferase [Syntrophales bacterium]
MRETTINPATSLLLTDLYQLTMLQGYLRQGMEETAVFEFSVRDLPENRGFLMTAGLESVVRYLEGVRVTEEELDYLARCGRFSREVVDYLSGFRFTGDVQAMPEGTVFFPQEPVIRVVAPLPQAQLLETRIMNLIHGQVVMASKAARCVLAAGGKAGLIDFGVRRSHGAEAGIFAARSSNIAGFEGTSTVLAEPLYGIPVFGTMAHSFIEAFGSELEAFIDFARANPRATTLLIDTYDTIRGAARAVEAARILEKEGIKVNGVRLDS